RRHRGSAGENEMMTLRTGAPAACALLALACAAKAQSITNLGVFAGGHNSHAFSVSSDGTWVAGVADNSASLPRAFRWSAPGGLQSLGTLPGENSSWGYAISDDGQAAAGVGNDTAWRWTLSGGMQNLGTLPGGTFAECRGISGDGSTVLGDG